jgi:hypothetical protein
LHFISKYVNDIYIFLIQGDPKKNEPTKF